MVSTTINKRGLSQVITIVLIILLTLVAILIVWGFVRPTIESTGEQVGAECLTVDLQVTGCDITADTFTVKRNSGTGTLVAIRPIVDGNPCDVDLGTLDELESNTVANCQEGSPLATVNLVTGSEIEVAAVLTNQQLCQPTRTAFEC